MARTTFVRLGTALCVSLCAGISSFAQSPTRDVLNAIGASPLAMAAAGLSTNDLRAFVLRLRDSAEGQAVLSTIRQVGEAEEEWIVANDDFDLTSQESAQRLQAATAHLEARRQQMDAAVIAALEAGYGQITPAQAVRLRAWRQAPAGVPAELRIVPWTEAELRSIQAALLRERLADSSALASDSGSTALLAQARARPEVAEAAAHLSVMLTELTVAFQQSVQ